MPQYAFFLKYVSVNQGPLDSDSMVINQGVILPIETSDSTWETFLVVTIQEAECHWYIKQIEAKDV